MAKDYAPEKIVVTVGPKIITGFMDGTFVSATREVDSFTKKVGNDGEVGRTLSANRSGQIELTLMQTSSSNEYLSSLITADELTGSGKVPVMVKDLYGTTLLAASECWILKPADVEFSDDITGRTWTLVAGKLNMFVGSSKS